MNYKKWIFPNVDKAELAEIADDCGLDPLMVFIAPPLIQPLQRTIAAESTAAAVRLNTFFI